MLQGNNKDTKSSEMDGGGDDETEEPTTGEVGSADEERPVVGGGEQQPSSEQRNKKRIVLIMGATIILVVVAVALGAGLGVGLQNNEEDYSRCSMALALSPGTMVSGEFSIDLLVLDEHHMLTCDSVQQPFEGYWYTVKGTGSGMRAHIVSSHMHLSSLSMSVYSGDDCKELVCIGANGSGPGSSVAWESEVGVNYYVLVALESEGSFVVGETEGNYTMALEEFEVAVNDKCENAIPLASNKNTLTIGSTQYATGEIVPQCGSADHIRTYGLWYAVDGNGEALQASTCTSATKYFSELEIFSGSCDDLQCVIYLNDDEEYDGIDIECYYFDNTIYFENGHTDTVYLENGHTGFKGKTRRWNSTQGIKYYVYVQGETLSDSSPMGEFGLVYNQIESAGNDRCSDAAELVVNAETPLLSSNVDATAEIFVIPYDNRGECFGTGFLNDIWFKVLGTGLWLRASTANVLTLIEEQTMEVYSGTCGNFTCMGEEEVISGMRGSRVAWQSIAGDMYFVQIGVYERYSRNNVGITVQEFQPPANDDCKGAIELFPGDFVFGSTRNATQHSRQSWIEAYGLESYFECYSRGPDVWYRVVGTGKTMQASACYVETNYDASVNVLLADCTNLACLILDSERTDPEGACVTGKNYRDKWRMVTWNSTIGVQYFIHVGFQLQNRYFSNHGDFGLSIKDLN